LNSEDRTRTLRMVWQVFTLLSVLVIVVGGGLGAVTVLLGLSLMTVLATFIIIRVGPLPETIDNHSTRSKAKRSDTALIDQLTGSKREAEEAVLRMQLPTDGSVIGDDGEIISLGAPKVGTNGGGSAIGKRAPKR
jgi:hypothetical protein